MLYCLLRSKFRQCTVRDTLTIPYIWESRIQDDLNLLQGYLRFVFLDNWDSIVIILVLDSAIANLPLLPGTMHLLNSLNEAWICFAFNSFCYYYKRNYDQLLTFNFWLVDYCWITGSCCEEVPRPGFLRCCFGWVQKRSNSLVLMSILMLHFLVSNMLRKIKKKKIKKKNIKLTS